MLREDYVMRLAAQLGKALAHILGLSKRQRYPAALVAIDEALAQLLGLSLDSVMELSEGQLLAFLTLGGTAVEEGRAKVSFLAALLREAGAIHAAQERPDVSYECYLKALHLLLEVRLHDDEVRLPEYIPTVEGLVAQLDAYALPSHTNVALLRYYEQVGTYGKAEDALFEALEAELEDADVVEAGLAFYERLQRLSDEALIAGNLPRDEVEAGLVELQARQRVQGGRLNG